MDKVVYRHRENRPNDCGPDVEARLLRDRLRLDILRGIIHGLLHDAPHALLHLLDRLVLQGVYRVEDADHDVPGLVDDLEVRLVPQADRVEVQDRHDRAPGLHSHVERAPLEREQHQGVALVAGALGRDGHRVLGLLHVHDERLGGPGAGLGGAAVDGDEAVVEGREREEEGEVDRALEDVLGVAEKFADDQGVEVGEVVVEEDVRVVVGPLVPGVLLPVLDNELHAEETQGDGRVRVHKPLPRTLESAHVVVAEPVTHKEPAERAEKNPWNVGHPEHEREQDP